MAPTTSEVYLVNGNNAVTEEQEELANGNNKPRKSARSRRSSLGKRSSTHTKMTPDEVIKSKEQAVKSQEEVDAKMKGLLKKKLAEKARRQQRVALIKLILGGGALAAVAVALIWILVQGSWKKFFNKKAASKPATEKKKSVEPAEGFEKVKFIPDDDVGLTLKTLNNIDQN
jgi:hypothetical protein